MIAQLVGVFAQYRSDERNIGRRAIEMETDALAKGISLQNGQAAFNLPSALSTRYGEAKTGYLVRVRTAAGTQLFSNCDLDCNAHFPPLDLTPLTFWMRQARSGELRHIVGGRVAADIPEPVMIEIAIIDDRDGVFAHVLAHEVMEHMLLPMSLMLIFVLGATIFSVAQVLRPVEEAASQVSLLDPGLATTRLPTAGMPREVAGFTQAVNAAFDRVAELMRSQKLLTSAISHEVRTPLAVVRLELAKIADPRARVVEEDLDALNHLVEQLTDFARVEGASIEAMEEIHPAALAERVVGDLAELVYTSGKSIEFVDRDAKPFKGHFALIENALRNLIENAARHTPRGAAIRVEAGPGSEFSVIDDGDKVRGSSAPQPAAGASDRQGLGLKIVGRIADIHLGRFEWARVQGMGVTARIDFAPGH